MTAADGKEVNRAVGQNYLIHIIILLAIAAGVGIYLIATTVLIAKDGVFYIERAQEFSSDPVGIIKGHPFGYPFLIFVTHKFAATFSDGSSVYSWIYSAQAITLFCRLIALMVLYFIGRFLFGGKVSFWAILILAVLPWPAEIGSDVLRDWPHMLFLAAGFLFLIWGAAQSKWWLLGLAGLAAGLGQMIRPECAQLVLYGIIWLVLSLFRQRQEKTKVLCAALSLLICFAIPTAFYAKARGKVLPVKLKQLISSSAQPELNRTKEQDSNDHNHIYAASNLPGKIVKAIGKLFERISENLMYFFLPGLLIGMYYRLCKKSKATQQERFFMPAFIILNIIMLTLLYCNYEYISRRHVLPLVAISIFYVPIGLGKLAEWFGDRFSKERLESSENRRRWFLVLVLIGMGICVPKLLKPIRIEKAGYRDAARWLDKHTGKDDIIAVPDKRIGFYAQRAGIETADDEIPEEASYIVKIEGSDDERLTSHQNLHQEYWQYVDKRKKKGKVVIYKILLAG